MAQGTPTAADRPYLSGITPRSVVACVFAMLVMAMHIQFTEILLADPGAPAEQSLPIQAMAVFSGLLLMVGGIAVVSKFRLLRRQELLCVFFAMMISAPMMTQGMWHRFLSLIATVPRGSAFTFIDAYNDKLWPHGENLLDGSLSADQRAGITAAGNPLSWQAVVTDTGEVNLPQLANTRAEEQSSFSMTLPLAVSGKPGIVPGEAYLISFLVRPEGLGSSSRYYCRIYYDDDPTFTELVADQQPSKITFLHKDGFVRIGAYGIYFDTLAKQSIRVEFGLSGPGKLLVADPKLFSVAALEGAYRGKKVILASDFAKLPPEKQANLIVKPDNMWSFSGLAFLVKGYIPVKDWAMPALAWSIPIMLLLAATLAINVIMRKQWAESERYPFPLFQVPYALLGEVDENPDAPFAKVWRNPYMWSGLAIAWSFGMLKAWHFYNATVPDVTVDKMMSDYLADPGWGDMWKIKFSLVLFFVGIALFFEINVLFSLLLGFFLFRAQSWYGEVSGAKVTPGFPFRYHQAVGAYLGYFFAVLIFTRRYLLSVFKQAFSGMLQNRHEEVFSYRVSLLVIISAFIGLAGWARWINVAILPILLFFAFLMVLGFVAAKFRAECGLPVGYFTPYNGMLFVSLLGGMATFGAQAMLVCLIAAGFMTASVFFFIPGAQLELVEYGRRYHMKSRHVIYTVILGVLGGLFIGGWVFLSNSYAYGGDNIIYQWSYASKMWFFSDYNRELAENTSHLQNAAAAVSADGVSTGMAPTTIAYIYGGVITVILSFLRQAFAGFWFHPIGFILGSAHMMEWVWGGCLVALVVRYTVLKLGGAATVKTKLMPFAVGLVLGSVVAVLCYNVIAIYMRSHGVEITYSGLP